jgi:hypothetical protein
MEKLDLKKQYNSLYNASSKKMDIVIVPRLNYLMIDGTGNPNNSQTFQEAIKALYSLSYTLKFMIKKGAQQIDYSVMPLEGLWWTDDMNNFSMDDKAAWKWTLMIMQPDFINQDLVDQATKQVRERKTVPALDKVRFEAMEEGQCAHILYIGPYNEEPPTIVKLHEFIRNSGYKLTGKHREIYLNDMRRTAPEKLKTIIRQPISK